MSGVVVGVGGELGDTLAGNGLRTQPEERISKEGSRGSLLNTINTETPYTSEGEVQITMHKKLSEEPQ